MDKFVKVVFDLYADRIQPDSRYRIYLEDELLVERTWRWDEDTYLEEMLQIKAEPGLYKVSLEKALPTKTRFTVKNLRVELGDARIKDDDMLEIL